MTTVYGIDSIEAMLELESYLFKIIASDADVVAFPHTTEHRDASQPGIQYADDSQGNALSGIVKPGRIEFRFHRQFSDKRVQELASRILRQPEFEFASSFAVVYQGRTIIAGSGD